MTNSKNLTRRLSVSALMLVSLAYGSADAKADANKADRTIVGLSSKAESAQTTLRIKGSATPTFTVYKLENPDRIVVDIVGSSLSSKLRKDGDKAVWSVNSWAVGQVSAHNMSKSSGELVRVVVGLSRASSYQVKAIGNDVVVEVTAKSKPEGIDPAMLQRVQNESASARKAAELELASARAEADRIRGLAAQRELEAKERIAQAEKLMAEATGKSAQAIKAQRLANAEIANAQLREKRAVEAEERAAARQDSVAKAEEAAKLALAEAEKARAQNKGQDSKLEAKAEAAARTSEQRRKQAEEAMRLAESRRQAAEQASQEAESRRQAAASALALATREREAAEAQRDSAIDSSKSANEKRAGAEAAAEAAAKRAQELRALVAAEESRFDAARNLRTQEEAAVAAAQKAHQDATRQSQDAERAERKLRTDIATLSKARQEAESRRVAAEAAVARAEKAAADSKVSASERDRLAQEARNLSASRDAAQKSLSQQEAALSAQRTEVATLGRKKQEAEKSLLALQEQAEAARVRRADEEKQLSALSAKRADMKGQLDAAKKMRILAKNELEQARQAREAAEQNRAAAVREAQEATLARSKASAHENAAQIARDEATKDAQAAKDARSRAQQAEVDLQNELELAKRARLAAESERQAVAEQMRLAKVQEEAAKARLADSKRARQSAQSDRQAGAEAIATAREHEESANKALEQARAERELAEAARQKGAEALAMAAEREKQAAKTLAQANKSQAVVNVVEAKTRLNELDVVQRQDVSRVVIAMNAPAAPRVLSNRGDEAVLEIPLAAIRDDQERTLDTSSLRGAVKAVSSYRDPKNPNNLKIVVDLTGPSKGTLKKVGNTYYWEFPALREQVANTTPEPNKVKSTSYRTQSVAGYGSASSPITQQTVAQLSNRRRKTYSGQKIDLDYKKSDIHDLMRLLADVGGVNIIVPDDIKARVTIRLRRVPWDQALDVILASKGLGFKMEGPKLFRIATQKELDAEFEAKLARARAKADSEAPNAEIFNLNYVNAAEVKKQLESMKSPKGSLQVDTRSNAIIINDVAANRRRIIEMLTRLDSETPQVQIEARIVEARSTFVRQFGIQWGGNISASAAGGNATGLIFPSSIGLAGAADDGQTPVGGLSAAPSDFAVNLPAAIGTGSGGGIGLSLGSVGGNLGLNLRLSALEDEGSVRIISSPKITTSNNIEAQIKSGVSIPVSVVSASGVQTQFVPADLELKVKPSVSLRDCGVSMDIQVKKNEADFVNTGARGDPTLLTKEAKTTVLVQDGDTSVIGGIYTRNSGVAYSKVPFFGDLPVVGWLFKTTRENDERTEVLIFITPKITNRASLPCAQ